MSSGLAGAMGPNAKELDAVSAKPLASAYELFMLVLCILALVILAGEALLPIDPESRRILNFVDNGVCAVFLMDFLRSLVLAPSKRHYFLTWGWLDLLSSLPSVDALRWGRAARIVRVLRLLRGLRATRVLVGLVARRRAESTVFGAILLCLILVTFSAISVLYVEANATGATIRSAEDALWWACVTVATVGYGDFVPVSVEGRLIGGVLMTLGVGLFATFSGFVASWFLGRNAAESTAELQAFRDENQELRAETQHLRSENYELRTENRELRILLQRSHE